MAFKTEIIVRTVTNCTTTTTFRVIAIAAVIGVSTINLAAKQDEDEVAWASPYARMQTAPRASGYQAFDALGETIRRRICGHKSSRLDAAVSRPGSRPC